MNDNKRIITNYMFAMIFISYYIDNITNDNKRIITYYIMSQFLLHFIRQSWYGFNCFPN